MAKLPLRERQAVLLASEERRGEREVSLADYDETTGKYSNARLEIVDISDEDRALSAVKRVSDPTDAALVGRVTKALVMLEKCVNGLN